MKLIKTVQIMIGSVLFTFGIVLKNVMNGVTADSRVTYWGAFCFVSAGGLAITSVDYYRPSVVKASLVMNVVSVLAAVVAVVVFSVDLRNCQVELCSPCFYELSMYYCQLELKGILGSTGVLLVFVLFEVFISIKMFLLNWKARGSPQIVSLTNDRPVNNPPEENSNSP
ncbi:hypothetical protein KOW79_010422 [Hemibagrus wyckioides]|uniref:Uncharacterized protein n=1 Tax=Hemibagrus wyckioides TaxID=337641 RepID=A0A9D3SJP0_9TELE|nr:hypothetical protein KOW79_010422 [Hemibagrus wyckioides]